MPRKGDLLHKRHGLVYLLLRLKKSYCPFSWPFCLKKESHCFLDRKDMLFKKIIHIFKLCDISVTLFVPCILFELGIQFWNFRAHHVNYLLKSWGDESIWISQRYVLWHWIASDVNKFSLRFLLHILFEWRVAKLRSMLSTYM